MQNPKLHKLALNIHLYLGLGMGIILLILAVTGTIIPFEEELEHVANPQLYYVTPQAKPLPLEVLKAKAEEAMGKPVAVLGVSDDPGIAYSARTADLKGGVVIDQYTGQVRTNKSRTSNFIQSNHRLHIAMLGKSGGNFFIATVVLMTVPMTIAGLYLWWPLKRLKIRRGGSRRKFYFDTHNSVGFFSSLFITIVAVTGTVIAFDRWTFPVFYSMTNSQPVKPPARSAGQPGGKSVTFDQVMASARAALPGAEPINIMAPKDEGGVFRVAMHFPNDRTPGGRSRVYVDEYTAKALLVESTRSAPGGATLVLNNRQLHTGEMFGLPGKIFYVLICLALIFQTLSGPYLWWTGRKKKAAGPRRGARNEAAGEPA